MSQIYTSIISDKTITRKKCMKTLINTSFHYIFPKPNRPAPPLQPYVTQKYILFSQDLPKLIYKVDQKKNT